jgi:Lon-like protease
MRSTPIRWTKARIAGAVSLAVVLGFLTFYPLPYFIKTPGSAEPVKGRVSIEGSEWQEEGDFLFTTVLQHIKPSILEFAYVRLKEKYTETIPVQKAIGNVSDVDAYNQLTEWMRIDSESSAVMAAYKYIGKPLQVEQTGVIIRSFLKGSPASKLLHEGDIVIGAEGQTVHTAAELAERLKGKKTGDTVSIQVQRGKKTVEAAVPLIDLDSENGTPRPGIGFYHSQVQKALPDVPVKFKLNDIGGPSAGLMLSLDIVSKLEQKDYTRGRKIAGTGTIDAEGNVGQIGGIRYKLVAASREGAEYFLTPKDVQETDGNQKEAEEFLKTYDTPMKLVPVATLKEAADFLAALPVNTAAAGK